MLYVSDTFQLTMEVFISAIKFQLDLVKFDNVVVFSRSAAKHIDYFKLISAL